MADLTRYKAQFDVLMHVLDLFGERYKPNEHEKPNGDETSWPRQAEIYSLVKGLQWFAKGQFSFFYNGFADHRPDGYPALNPAISKDDKQVQFPIEHVLAKTLAQISADLSVIQQAAEQRITSSLIYGPSLSRDALTSEIAVSDKSAEKDSHSAKKEDFFASVDKFAQMSLWKAKNVFDEPLVGKKLVMTYLSDSIHVRVVPYASVVFIGVPSSISAQTNVRYALAHEIGHFRFWDFFSPTSKTVTTSDRKVLNWVKNVKAPRLNLRELRYPFEYAPKRTATPRPPWQEEIFADVYGVLFGGPEYIKSAMDMALEHSATGLVNFDYEDVHPTPLIRPVLMIKALGELNKGPQPLLPLAPAVVEGKAIALYNQWKRKLQDREILYGEPSSNVVDDTRDLALKFSDTDIATRVGKTIAWHTREMDLSTVSGKDLSKLSEAELKSLSEADKQRKFHVEELVVMAVQALRYAFEDAPITDIPWGWSENVSAEEQALKDSYVELAAFKKMIEASSSHIISLSDSRHKLAFLQVFRQPWLIKPPLQPKEPTPPESLPDDWKEWVINQKGYFEKDFFDNKLMGEVLAGDYDTVMDPSTRPSGTWLPVFGAGGWTSEGPCHFWP